MKIIGSIKPRPSINCQLIVFSDVDLIEYCFLPVGPYCVPLGFVFTEAVYKSVVLRQRQCICCVSFHVNTNRSRDVTPNIICHN